MSMRKSHNTLFNMDAPVDKQRLTNVQTVWAYHRAAFIPRDFLRTERVRSAYGVNTEHSTEERVRSAYGVNTEPDGAGTECVLNTEQSTDGAGTECV